jgi:hypothetical protein
MLLIGSARQANQPVLLRDENSRAGFRNPQDTTRSRSFREGRRSCSSASGHCTVALYALKLLLDRVNNAFRDH